MITGYKSFVKIIHTDRDIPDKLRPLLNELCNSGVIVDWGFIDKTGTHVKFFEPIDYESVLELAELRECAMNKDNPNQSEDEEAQEQLFLEL